MLKALTRLAEAPWLRRTLCVSAGAFVLGRISGLYPEEPTASKEGESTLSGARL